MSVGVAEFRITSDLTAVRQQAIEANFDEVREWLDVNLAPFRSMAVTPETMTTAKTYRASIRKVKDRIEQSRKEAKSAALQAYQAFEVKCKELTGLCDEAANNLDAQVKAIETAEKQEKINKLFAVYAENASDEIKTYLPWERVADPKWANKGYNFDTAAEEIKAAIFYTEHDLTSVREMGGDDTAYLLDVYKTTHDLNAVIRKKYELDAVRERERKRAQEAEERKRAQEAQVHEPAPVEDDLLPPPTTEYVTVSFTVTCTKDRLAGLGAYMREHGIQYRRAV